MKFVKHVKGYRKVCNPLCAKSIFTVILSAILVASSFASGTLMAFAEETYVPTLVFSMNTDQANYFGCNNQSGTSSTLPNFSYNNTNKLAVLDTTTYKDADYFDGDSARMNYGMVPGGNTFTTDNAERDVMYREWTFKFETNFVTTNFQIRYGNSSWVNGVTNDYTVFSVDSTGKLIFNGSNNTKFYYNNSVPLSLEKEYTVGILFDFRGTNRTAKYYVTEENGERIYVGTTETQCGGTSSTQAQLKHSFASYVTAYPWQAANKKIIEATKITVSNVYAYLGNPFDYTDVITGSFDSIPNKIITPPDGKMTRFPVGNISAYGAPILPVITPADGFVYYENGYIYVKPNSDETNAKSYILKASYLDVSKEKTFTLLPQMADDFNAYVGNTKPQKKNDFYYWSNDISTTENQYFSTIANRVDENTNRFLTSSTTYRYGTRFFPFEAIDAAQYGDIATLEFAGGIYDEPCNIAGSINGSVYNTAVESVASNPSNSNCLVSMHYDYKNNTIGPYHHYLGYDASGSGNQTAKTKLIDTVNNRVFVNYKLVMNLKNATYDLYEDAKLVADDYKMNAEAQSFKIAMIMFGSSMDDFALYNGEDVDLFSINAPTRAIAPPAERTASIPVSALYNNVATDVSLLSSYSAVHLDENKNLIIEPNAVPKAETEDAADPFINVRLKFTSGAQTRWVNVKILPPMAENFDSYAINGFPKGNDFYKWGHDYTVDFKSQVQKREGTTGNNYLNIAGGGAYSAKVCPVEPIDKAYGNVVTVEFSTWHYANENNSNCSMGSIFNTLYNTTSSTYAANAFVMGLQDDFQTKQTTPYSYYTSLTEDGLTGSFGAKSNLVLSEQPLGVWRNFKYVLDFVNDTYDVYLDNTLICDNYHFSTASTLNQLSTMLFTACVDDFSIYSGNGTYTPLYDTDYDVSEYETYLDSVKTYDVFKNGYFEVKTSIDNHLTDAMSVTMLLAQYSNDNELINISSTAKSVPGGENMPISTGITVNNYDKTYAKVYLFSDLKTIKPLIAAKKIRANRASNTATLYLVGDSICQTYPHQDYPRQGWGYYINQYLSDSVTVDNRARSGWTTKSFIESTDAVYSWKAIKAALQPGDIVLIALGINDASTTNPAKTTEEEYIANLEIMIADIEAAGAEAVFATPTISGGTEGTETGWTYSTSYGWGQRGEVCRLTAEKYGYVCIPLGATLSSLYETMYTQYMAENTDATIVQGRDFVRHYFHLYASNLIDSVENGGWGLSVADGTLPSTYYNQATQTYQDDPTHVNERGATKFAEVICTLIKNSKCSLADFIK